MIRRLWSTAYSLCNHGGLFLPPWCNKQLHTQGTSIQVRAYSCIAQSVAITVCSISSSVPRIYHYKCITTLNVRIEYLQRNLSWKTLYTVTITIPKHIGFCSQHFGFILFLPRFIRSHHLKVLCNIKQ